MTNTFMTTYIFIVVYINSTKWYFQPINVTQQYVELTNRYYTYQYSEYH